MSYFLSKMSVPLHDNTAGKTIRNKFGRYTISGVRKGFKVT